MIEQRARRLDFDPPMAPPIHILGISAFYHDSAACLVRDGEIVAAAQEERFTRKKHDDAFPSRAVRYCLDAAGISGHDLDYVAFYDKPLLKFDRLLETYLAFAPRGLTSFAKAMPVWLGEKLRLTRELDRGLSRQYRGRYVFPEHHESHAASAFFPSPFPEAAIMTLDGVGEWATASLGVGRGNQMELTHELRFPHSLGLLYSAFTYFTGFKVNSGEYKLMGLAPYGEPKYRKLILDELMDLKEDGSLRLDLSYFDYCTGLTMTTRKMERLFGGPARSPEAPLTQREMDIAASIQAITEEVMLRSSRFLARETKMRSLVMAGGVALNCVGNGKILRDGHFDEVWIQPASGDAGGALGAALLVWHQLLEHSREVDGARDRQKGSFLGPSYSDDEVRKDLDRLGAQYREIEDEDELLDFVADQLVAQKVVGFFQGRMEFGPRALGGRSILGDARSPEMQTTMNVKIKFRESFRPFAPSVLREDVSKYFDVEAEQQSPYMLLVAPVQQSERLEPGEGAAGLFGIDLLKLPRSTIPAVTHVDHSARLQTVDEINGRYHRLIRRFRDKTGCSVIINTSFNVRGEPIVCSPEDAYRCFQACNMDVLVVERCVLLREDQPAMSADERERYRSGFALD